MQHQRRLARILAKVLFFATSLLVFNPVSAQSGIRLYIFDNGEINGLDPALFNFSADEVTETDFVATSYLIVHPKGTLLWEAGAIPDTALPSDGGVYTEGPIVVDTPLLSQMQAVGYGPQDIDYFAMSHLHSDHNGNANVFASSQWIVQKADRDMMFSGAEVRVMVPAHFTALEQAPTLLLDNEDHDVFGDGSVRIISAPGHTPGHQVLLVQLDDFGSLLLAGDLYHFPEEITTERFPTFEFDTEMSGHSREKIQALLKETGATMWIGHDKATHARLKFAPEYYE
jgi:N-acyl homoserine lactone hydrolase